MRDLHSALKHVRASRVAVLVNHANWHYHSATYRGRALVPTHELREDLARLMAEPSDEEE